MVERAEWFFHSICRCGDYTLVHRHDNSSPKLFTFFFFVASYDPIKAIRLLVTHH